jgi:hypothetical protein
LDRLKLILWFGNDRVLVISDGITARRGHDFRFPGHKHPLVFPIKALSELLLKYFFSLPAPDTVLWLKSGLFQLERFNKSYSHMRQTNRGHLGELPWLELGRWR